MDGGQGDTMVASAPPAQCLWLWASLYAPSLSVLPPLWFSLAPLYPLRSQYLRGSWYLPERSRQTSNCP